MTGAKLKERIQEWHEIKKLYIKSVCEMSLVKVEKSLVYVRGAYDKFPDFFRMGTFIDSTHIKL